MIALLIVESLVSVEVRANARRGLVWLGRHVYKL